MLTRDERYKTLIQGLQATIVTLRNCYGFVAELSEMGGPYQQRTKEIRQILGTAEFSALIETDIYKEISAKTIASFDHLVKNKKNREIKDVLDFIAEVDVNITVANVAATKRIYLRQSPAKRNEHLTGNRLETSMYRQSDWQ